MADSEGKNEDIKAVNPLREELGRLADEVRLQLHLGGMEAKDAWHRIEPRLSRFDEMAGALTDEVARELKVLGRELKDDLSKLRRSLKDDSKGGA